MIEQYTNPYTINTILSILIIVFSVVFQNKYPEIFSNGKEEEDRSREININISERKQKTVIIIFLAFILFTPYVNMLVATIMAVSTFLNVYKYNKNRER
ncbi:MAG: hypothetical protein GX895_01555 [Clostridiales bacterium]|uniref:hypothetical protein n=1 Tax=Clostridium sp. N3C TaxID=1776758 RepID=UPI00092DEEB9|nr:hypothetical protein [Clostridium sp. N3C]NLZ47468.1 hypothetical protein [Clostridiales bacterium]SCN22878.1 hypothetical protein N3C_1007 [Clostridium sp. N3C]